MTLAVKLSDVPHAASTQSVVSTEMLKPPLDLDTSWGVARSRSGRATNRYKLGTRLPRGIRFPRPGEIQLFRTRSSVASTLSMPGR